tara:strand:+ start:1403 stop:1597 length:195 start_codon:yes stop_codon:yes gene_type:complete
MFRLINLLLFFIASTGFSTPVFARCAVCYTNGLSGASIAVMVIVFSFILLFFANKLLQKFLNRT